MKISPNKGEVLANDPFQASGSVSESACIDNWMQFSKLAECYIRSGDALVTGMLENHNLLDVYVYGACFLYRQCLELILKDLAWKSHYLLTGDKIFTLPKKEWEKFGGHRLTPWWLRGRDDAKLVLGEDFPINPAEISQIQRLLAQYEKHDPDSFDFRYPISKNHKRTHASLTNVNIRNLGESVHHAFDLIKYILGLIDLNIQLQSEAAQ